METASADSMPEGVERQGIGTPATRAATIEKLVQKGFLERKGTKKTKVDRKSTRLNSSHRCTSRMPSSA